MASYVYVFFKYCYSPRVIVVCRGNRANHAPVIRLSALVCDDFDDSKGRLGSGSSGSSFWLHWLGRFSGSPEKVTRPRPVKSLLSVGPAKFNQTCKQRCAPRIPMTLNCLPIKRRSAEISAKSEQTIARRSSANTNQKLLRFNSLC